MSCCPVAAGAASTGVADAQEGFEVEVTAPQEVTTGETVTVAASTTVPEMPGDYESTLTVDLYADGERVASEDVTVEDGETVEVALSHAFEDSGTATLEVSAGTTIAGQTFAADASTLVDVIDGAGPESTSVDGAAFAVPESLADDVEAYRESAPVDLGVHAFVLATEDRLHLVFTDRDPKKGRASVEGLALEESIDGGQFEFGVVAATDVSFDQNGDPAAVRDVAENPDAYELDLLRFDATHRRLAIRTAPDDGPSFSTTTGTLRSDPPTATDLFADVGARTSELVRDPESNDADALDDFDGPRLFTGSFETAFWTDATAVTDGIVLAPGSAGYEFLAAYDHGVVDRTGSGEPILYVVREQYGAEEVDDVGSISERAADLDGDVVTVEARLYQRTISVQETVEASTGCGDEQVMVDKTCVDVVQDVVLHGGVAWNEPPERPEDAVFALAASSRPQDVPVEHREGRYEITGEVVASDRIDDDLPDGTVLLIYDLERVGDIDYASVADESREIIEGRTDELGTHFETQATVAAEGSSANGADDGGTASGADESESEDGATDGETTDDGGGDDGTTDGETTDDGGGDDADDSTPGFTIVGALVGALPLLYRRFEDR